MRARVLQDPRTLHATAPRPIAAVSPIGASDKRRVWNLSPVLSLAYEVIGKNELFDRAWPGGELDAIVVSEADFHEDRSKCDHYRQACSSFASRK